MWEHVERRIAAGGHVGRRPISEYVAGILAHRYSVLVMRAVLTLPMPALVTLSAARIRLGSAYVLDFVVDVRKT